MKNPSMQAFLLRMHRWITLVLAIPLAVLILTGLVLSFNPIQQAVAVKPGSLTLAQLQAHLAKHDPKGEARGMILDHRMGTLSIQGKSRRDSVTVDLKSSEKTSHRHWYSSWVRFARPIHEHFVYDLDWVVPLSTAAMLVSMLIGMFMGLPRMTNSLSGWHKVTAWTLLPLLLLSPLTGLLMTYRISLSAPAPRSEPLPLIEALRVTAKQHDPSTIAYIRQRGPREMVLINTGSSQSQYVPAADGLKPMPVNLPRVFHQGDFFGIWGGVMNVILSLAFCLLLGSGLWIWARRTFRKRNRVRPAGARSASAA